MDYYYDGKYPVYGLLLFTPPLVFIEYYKFPAYLGLKLLAVLLAPILVYTYFGSSVFLSILILGSENSMSICSFATYDNSPVVLLTIFP